MEIFNQTESVGRFLWSSLSDIEPPPSLVKCLGATAAGITFAFVGVMMERVRGQKSRPKENFSRDELAALIPPKRTRGPAADAGEGSQAAGSSTRQRAGLGKPLSAPVTATGAADQSPAASPAAAGGTSTPSQRLAPTTVAPGGRELSEVEEAERKVKSCLNKLTRDNFNKLYEQIIVCITTACSSEEDRTEMVEVVARDLFAKATKMHTFVELYADLCAKLHSDLEKDGVTVNFKRILLDQCQQSFKLHLEPPKVDQSLEYEERYEQLVKYKTKMLGNVKLIGHLLRREMLSPKIIFHCTDELLSIGTEESLETLCCFLDTIGTTFDSSDWQGRPRLEEVFTRVELLVEDTRQSSRIRCLLKDLLDKRRSSWRDPSSNNAKW